MFSEIWHEDNLSNIIYERVVHFKKIHKQLFPFSPVPDNVMRNTHLHCHWLCTLSTITAHIEQNIISFTSEIMRILQNVRFFSTTVHLLTFLERAANKVKTFEFSGKSLKIEVCTTIFLLLPPNSDVNRSRILLPTIAFNPTILPAKSIPKTQPQSCNQCVLLLTAG